MIRIGTRGSALALAQAAWVAERIGQQSELVAIRNEGPQSDKSRWVSGLERALLAGEVDLAVHSAKDVPAEIADGLELVAFPQRADARDAICGADSLRALRSGARVGTSSLRREAQVRAMREDVEVVSIRGNVDTRLRKLADGDLDALVLARAGLERLGRGHEAGGVLDELVPAAGQGSLAIEARAGEFATELRERLDDPQTRACVTAERQLTRALGASCNTPVGAHASPLDGDEVELVAWVGRPDGSLWLRDQLRGAPGEVGQALGERMLSAGAAELLEP